MRSTARERAITRPVYDVTKCGPKIRAFREIRGLLFSAGSAISA